MASATISAKVGGFLGRDKRVTVVMGESGAVGSVAFVKDGGEVLGPTGAGRGLRWCIWGCLFVFGFKRGGSTIFGPDPSLY